MGLNLSHNPLVLQGPASGSLMSGLTLIAIQGISFDCPSSASGTTFRLSYRNLPVGELATAFSCHGPQVPLPFPTPLKHAQHGFRFVIVGSGTAYIFH